MATASEGRRPLRGRSVRLRLTLVYGVLFVVSGAGLLAITYVFVDRAAVTRAPAGVVVAEATDGGSLPGTSASPVASGQASAFVSATSDLDAKVQLQLDQQRRTLLHRLVIGSALALTLMLVAAVALGWVVAGRVLRPLRRMTTDVREISATNLHRRLAATGPQDEIRELSDTFDSLLDRLDAAFAAQRRFVANASHELRSPLARQRVIGEVALSDPDASTTSLREAHERILAAGGDQERIVDALLVLAKGQHGTDRTETFDLAAMVRGVVAGAAAATQEHRIVVSQSLEPARLTGDPTLVERLVTNLVDNALLHNAPGGEIVVATTTHGDQAVLTVTNTGPVVPPESLARLLEPFRRLEDDRTSLRPGSGLGLSIVAAIADAHGATLTLEPRDGGGLTVQVGFPAPDPQHGR